MEYDLAAPVCTVAKAYVHWYGPDVASGYNILKQNSGRNRWTHLRGGFLIFQDIHETEARPDVALLSRKKIRPYCPLAVILLQLPYRHFIKAFDLSGGPTLALARPIS